MSTTTTHIRDVDRAPQFMAALALANETRIARAAVKRRLGAGEITLDEAFDEPSVQAMQVRELLCAQRRWGTTRAEKAMKMLPCSGRKTVGGLTERQRVTLLIIVGQTTALSVAA